MHCYRNRILLAGSLSVILTAGLCSEAQAKDYCIDIGIGGTPITVLQGFSLPAKGKCKSVNGYTGTNETSRPNAFGGSACTDSAGTHVTIQLTNQLPPPNAAGFLLVYEFSLPLPSLGDEHSVRVYPSPADLGDILGTLALEQCAKPVPSAP